MSQANSANIVKSSLWMTISFVFARVAQLASQVVLARLISPTDFGIWAMVLSLNNISTLFRDVSIAQVLIQRGLGQKEVVNTVYSLGVNVSVCLFGLQAIASFPLSQFFGVPILFPLALCSGFTFLIGAGAGSHTAVMQQQMKFKELAICDSISGAARVTGALTCAAMGGEIWSFVVGEISMACADSLLKRSFSKYSFVYRFRLNASAVSSVRSFITGILFNNVAVQLNTTNDNLIIGRLLGAQALGYYNLAYQLAMTPVYALSQIVRVTLSALARRDSSGKKALLYQSLEVYALLAAPLYGLLFILSPWLIPSLYGFDWIASVRLFQIILIFAYARGMMYILGSTLVSLDKTLTDAFINWTLVPISTISYLLGAWLAGSQGVAIAVAVVMGIGATIWFFTVTCHAADIKIKVLLKPVLLPTVLVGAILTAIPVISSSISISLFVQAILLLTLYILVFSVFFKESVSPLLDSINRIRNRKPKLR